MSDTALSLFRSAFTAQAQKTEARRIRTRVRDARSGITGAESRWPFELLQNVHDAGPRPGQDRLNVTFRWDGSILQFEHDGDPFKLEEVAALLSGGSSKEFESDETTGRFGTGFMVTHALSCRIDLSIVIEVEGGYELAHVNLDREGDEEAILANIQRSHRAIQQATALANAEGMVTASLRYAVDRPDAVTTGIANLRRTIPYLFATCLKLGTVTIVTPELEEVWSASESEVIQQASPYIERRQVSDGTDEELLNVYAFKSASDSKVKLLALARGLPAGTEFLPPEPRFPRVFSKFPVRNTGSRPFPVVIDAPFDLPQERDTLLMSETDKALLQEALGVLPSVAAWAVQSSWIRAHGLAEVSEYDPVEEGEKNEAPWWNEQLGETASALARLPLVKTLHQGFLPAVVDDDGGGSIVDFVLPRFSLNEPNGPSLDRLWPLVSSAKRIDPPERTIAEHWSRIALGWEELGVEPSLRGLEEVVEVVIENTESIRDLDVDGPPMLWVARLVDLIAEWGATHAALYSRLLDGVMPDQFGDLSSPDDLSRDEGIPEQLKDLLEPLGIETRPRLLHADLARTAEEHGLAAVAPGLERLIPRTLGRANVLAELVAHLEKEAPDGTRVTEAIESVVLGVREILEFLWSSDGPEALEVARRLPLKARSGSVVRILKGMPAIGPILAWPESARPFANAYPAHRVLDDLYVQPERDSLVGAFSSWRIASPEPLTKEAPADLKEERLAAMSVTSTELTGVSVGGHAFSQIALLSEIIPGAGMNQEQARALLGLVLCYAAGIDPSWRESQEISGRRSGEVVPCTLRGALWLGDLLYRAWLPAKGEGNKTISVTATAAALKPLLDPAWLRDNDAAIDLLTAHFGFNPLELRITAAATDDAARAKLEEGLAALVQVAGADSEVYAQLAEDLAARKKTEEDVDRNRTLGLAVQEVVRECMVRRGLQLTLIDHGYDYDVKLSDGDPLLDGAHRLGIGSWLMEVKATTSGDVRMTPTQATRASEEPARYLLCVVDLRDLLEEERKGPWTPEVVEPRVKIFPQIGHAIAPTCDLVAEAVENEVGIRNEKVLRYSVPPSVWGDGTTIDQWMASFIAGTPGVHQ